MLDLDRDLTSDRAVARRREWLVTNGIGGYAMGTVAGLRTRRYHGVLVAALDPPLGRTLFVTQTDETVRYGGALYPLGTQEWADRTVAPTGFEHLDRFHLEGTVPVWTYICGDAVLEKRLWMEHGSNTTYVRYTYVQGCSPLHISAKALVTHRDYHGTTVGDGWRMDVSERPDGVQVEAYEGAPPLYLRSAEADATSAHAWYQDQWLSVEADRGLDAVEDHLHASTFTADLTPGDSVTLVCSTDAEADLDGTAARARQKAHEQARLDAADGADARPRVQHLVRAADQFVVSRPTDDIPDGQSIIAGYPWFGDWGRDTMIALPGLTLATGRPDVAARILRTYGRYVDHGMVPNRFPDHDDTPEYNTADATLWYVEALRATVDATDDTDLLADLFPVLEDIVRWHVDGTRYGIGVDPEDGLLQAGEPGVQLTWMDAKVGDWVVTPRIGKPVEINALWLNALRCIEAFAEQLGEDPAPFASHADRAEASFERFWNAERGFCYDVLDGPDGHDPRLRPNQLFAVSLPHSPLPEAQQRAVVDACASHLYTPHGLRSLSPKADDYVGTYIGDVHRRDGAYHQGTVWSWLIGPFVHAHLQAHGDPDAAQRFLNPLLRHLDAHGVGSISEIFDGDAPFTPRGTPAQAWGVAALLEAWVHLQKHRAE
mgnify:CR=1 FL=1